MIRMECFTKEQDNADNALCISTDNSWIKTYSIADLVYNLP